MLSQWQLVAHKYVNFRYKNKSRTFETVFHCQFMYVVNDTNGFIGLKYIFMYRLIFPILLVRSFSPHLVAPQWADHVSLTEKNIL